MGYSFELALFLLKVMCLGNQFYDTLNNLLFKPFRYFLIYVEFFFIKTQFLVYNLDTKIIVHQLLDSQDTFIML